MKMVKNWIVPSALATLLCASLIATFTGLESVLPVVWTLVVISVFTLYLVDGKVHYNNKVMAVFLIGTIVAVSAAPAVNAMVWYMGGGEELPENVKKFTSYGELENYLKDKYTDYRDISILPALPPTATIGMPKSVEDSGFSVTLGNDTVSVSSDYSTTNVQVKGVDEADIVKTDGKYIYVISKGRLIILLAYPVEEARVLSVTEIGDNPLEIFVNGNRLVIFESFWGNPKLLESVAIRRESPETIIRIYDISEKESPALVNEMTVTGTYFSSRMIGDYIYVVVNMYVYIENDVVILPQISTSGSIREISPTEIYYFDDVIYPNAFAIILAIDVQRASEVGEKVFLTTQAQNMYVSANSIYISYTTGRRIELLRHEEWEMKTIIHKISISNGEIEYKYRGEVPGQVLNQFSMDEFRGYFRIATTEGEVWTGNSRNNVYVLGENLGIVGKLEGLAPGERIYSARFVGDRVYLVTFKKVDPFFVIDLTDPAEPKVLGALKIPGYSDYLHPYDETHVIGIGKETVESEGDFALYQGVKLGLFDVSDPENPKEISKYIIGERGTESYALHDHRAFLFSSTKNLLVIPISLVEGDQNTWQGAYAFNISLSDGFVLRAKISHSGQNLDYSNDVKRSLYIDEALYTISEDFVKINDLSNFAELNMISIGK